MFMYHDETLKNKPYTSIVVVKKLVNSNTCGDIHVVILRYPYKQS